MRFQTVQLASDLNYDQRARLESHLYALSGVVTDVRPRRYYVEGELAAHLLGSLGEIQRAQLERRRYADYRQGEVIGQSGVEAVMQDELRGRAGGRNLVVNVAGRVEGLLDEIEPVSGGTVTGLSVLMNGFSVSGTAKAASTFYPLGFYEGGQGVSGTGQLIGDLEYRGQGLNKSSGTFFGFVDSSTIAAVQVKRPPPSGSPDSGS